MKAYRIVVPLRAWIIAFLGMLIGAVSSGGPLGPLPVHAAGFVVSSLADSGPSTLRQAMLDANAAHGADTITFTVSGTITLVSPLPPVSDPGGLTIDGTGQSVVISGNNAVQPLYVSAPLTHLTLRQMTVTRGKAVGSSGGAILNTGTLTLEKSAVTDSEATNTCFPCFGGNGGGIANTGTLTVTNTTISGNRAHSPPAGCTPCLGGNGGAIFSVGSASAVTVTNSTLSDNRAGAVGDVTLGAGGGVYNGLGTLTVTGSTVSGNVAAGGFTSTIPLPQSGGGGIFSFAGTLTVSGSTVSGNVTHAGGGGIDARSFAVTVTASVIRGNRSDLFGGGGLRVSSGSITDSEVTGNTSSGIADGGGGGIAIGSGALTISRTTISGNVAESSRDGGGILNGGALTLTNSTVSGNTAEANGGGIYNGGGLTLGNVTVSGNTAGGNGGGVHNQIQATLINTTVTKNAAGAQGGGLFNTGGTADLSNTILGTNNAISGPDCWGFFSNPGTPNLLSSTSGCNTVGAPPLVGAPLLAALGNYGGSTKTHALLGGSPAIDAGGDPFCSAAPVNGVDQRGVARPVGPHCDLGAYEGSIDVLGGKNLTIKAPGPAVNLTWDPGNLQADYIVARAQFIPAGPTTFSAPLPATASGYTDPAPPSSSLLCYQVVARDGGGATLGLSDFDCAYTGFAGGTVIPGGFTLGLNQSATASLTWTAPAGGPVDGYALYKLPFDGSPITFEALGAGATSSVQNMGATHYCYTLVAFRSGAFGNTNLVCGIQGLSASLRLGRTLSVTGAAGLEGALGPLRAQLGEAAKQMEPGAWSGDAAPLP